MSLPMPTTDPMDTGNKPGDGPLRAGGESVPGIMIEQANMPSTRSPRAASQLPAVQLCRDLWGGNETVKAVGMTYLPKAPGETSANYATRLARSVFFNAFRRSVEGLVGLVFRKDPVLGEDVPEPIRGHWEDLDGAGTHGDLFLRDQMADAVATGHNAILVDYPETGGGQTLADEIVLDLRPYWVPIRKEQILSWRTVQQGNRLILTQLVIEEEVWEPIGAYGETKSKRYRVFVRDDAGNVSFQLLAVTDQRKVVVLEEGTYPTQDEIPIAEVQTSGSTSLLESTPPLLDLAYLNIAHYQQLSDYLYSIHLTCVPFIFGSGMSGALDANGQPVGSIVVGPNSAILEPNDAAKMGYVSHDGASLGSSKAALDDLKSDMGSLGLAMLAPQKRTAETAEAKRLDKSTSDSALSVAARALQDAVERALYFHARYLRLDGGGSVTINRDFEGLLMDAQAMGAYAVLVREGMPPRLALEALQAGGRIAEDADLDALEMEWLGASVASAEAMVLEAEAVP